MRSIDTGLDMDGDDLGSRSALPERFADLLARLPRSAWTNTRLAPMAEQWLAVHDWFRGTLGDMIEAGRVRAEGRCDDQAYGAYILPRLRQFIDHLELHHRLETESAFPELVTADPELESARALLDRDHVQLEERLLEIQAAAQAFNSSLLSDESSEAFAMQLIASVAQSERPLLRHLADEEDLVIPHLTLGNKKNISGA
ncbi:hemerythrin domain-containing protein [Sphingomonas bisphenolicum]